MTQITSKATVLHRVVEVLEAVAIALEIKAAAAAAAPDRALPARQGRAAGLVAGEVRLSCESSIPFVKSDDSDRASCGESGEWTL